jgi:CheY-like chemotaxis protein
MPAVRVPRALVVDDEASIRRVLHRYLERAGWQVDDAGDGAAAEAQLFGSGVRYDLVICDLNLPDCTGLDLRSAIADRAPHLLERFVISTGESADGSGVMSGAEARELARAGRLLPKPFSLEELGGVLRTIAPAAAA